MKTKYVTPDEYFQISGENDFVVSWHYAGNRELVKGEVGSFRGKRIVLLDVANKYNTATQCPTCGATIRKNSGCEYCIVKEYPNEW